jgi:hypothetical protein
MDDIAVDVEPEGEKYEVVDLLLSGHGLGLPTCEQRANICRTNQHWRNRCQDMNWLSLHSSSCVNEVDVYSELAEHFRELLRGVPAQSEALQQILSLNRKIL